MILKGTNRTLIAIFSSVFLIILLSYIIPTYASVYAYIPTLASLNPIAPPVWLNDPQENQVTVLIGANRTSASITIKALTTNLELAFNSDFYTGPDGWHFVPGMYLTNAYWLPNYQGALGVIEVYGTIPGFNGDITVLFQNITIPSIPLSTLTEKITYYYLSRPSSRCFIIGGLYDWEDGLWVFLDALRCDENMWSEAVFNIDPSVVKPGKIYGLIAGVMLFNTIIFPQTYYIYYDKVELVAQTTNPVYSGNWLLCISDGNNYRGKLIVEETSFSGKINATVWLTSFEGSETSRIVIRDSKVIVSETSEIPFTQPPPGYSSLYFKIDTSVEPASSGTLSFKFRFKTGGVVAEYPLTLFIHDPENGREENVNVKFHKRIPVHKVRLENLLSDLGELIEK
ncbi:MAG: hypothetical protein DRN04_11610 [Thermoprotei archaeon]|nr:MAG: hypothetical protein DRN04_11610 [Thermoprotei archaeon]